jgi:hypothetical protein
MTEANHFAQLNYLKKVTGFANLGIFSNSTVIEKASNYVRDLKSTYVDFDSASAHLVIEAMSNKMMPSQQLCQAGMRSINQLILDLKENQGRESQDAQESSKIWHSARPQ